jgi:hypothetical protein
MTNLLDKLKQLLRSTDAPADRNSGLDETAVRRLMHLLDQTQDDMYCCEETFDLLDEYVERAANRQDAALLMPYVKRHLDLCPNCQEAYEALLSILETADTPPLS